MFEADRAALIDVYRRLANQPDDARRVGWPARWVQWLAFEMLVGIADLRDAEVLDVGCGLGDLYAFLAVRGGVGAYRGVDLAPDLVAAAQARHPGASFAVVDILASDLEPADYVIASALFDARTPNSPAVLRAVLRRLFALARCGLAWNIFLEPTAPDQYSEPLGALTAFCAGLTPYPHGADGLQPQPRHVLPLPARGVPHAAEPGAGRAAVPGAGNAPAAGAGAGGGG
ncbi:MAG: class I SAM-dependent methyltransferase [Anaerolineae bacterium]|nr:class I SAM-dependent methyltransferase [Anaerolineae bacterium]